MPKIMKRSYFIFIMIVMRDKGLKRKENYIKLKELILNRKVYLKC